MATEEMGLCEISYDGKQLINQYTTSNSPIVSNCIYDLCYNEYTNSLFMTTAQGVMEMKLDASPASDNYDNVYVYPDPVLPDFTGFVAIYGLMPNSQVVIKDRDGNVVAQFAAAEGTASWDCCDASGERVTTGNYSVYASQTAVTDDDKPVATIHVIK